MATLKAPPAVEPGRVCTASRGQKTRRAEGRPPLLRSAVIRLTKSNGRMRGGGNVAANSVELARGSE